MSPIVYRAASGTDDSFTPRPGKDTEGPKRGLSAFEDVSSVPPGRTHAIDLRRLQPPLVGIADRTGHVSIVPVKPSGEVDDALLKEWASFRKTGRCHRLTALVLAARIDEDVER